MVQTFEGFLGNFFQILDDLSDWHAQRGWLSDGDPWRVDFEGGCIRSPAECALRSVAQAPPQLLCFLPPERTGYLQEAQGVWSDLYSLGACCYLYLTGQYAIEPISERGALVRAILSQFPLSVRSWREDIPVSFDLILQKLLRKSPQERYLTISGLRHDLGRILEDSKRIFALGTRDTRRELITFISNVGRSSERSLLHMHLQGCIDGGVSCAMIGAPSGMGKSHLAQTFCIEAQQRGFAHLLLKCSELEKLVPFQALGGILGQLSALLPSEPPFLGTTVAEQLPPLPRGGLSLVTKRFPQLLSSLNALGVSLEVSHSQKEEALEQGTEEDRFLKSAAIALLLLCHAVVEHKKVTGIILLIDDLQWADGGSLDVLRYVFRCAETNDYKGSPIFVLGTYRSQEVHAEHVLQLRLLSSLDQGTLIPLGPLTAIESQELALQLLDEHSPACLKAADLCYQFCHGAPFSIYEFLKALVASPVLTYDFQQDAWVLNEALAQSLFLGSRVEQLVVQRVEALPPSARVLLLSLAVVAQQASQAAAQVLFEVASQWFEHRGNLDKNPFVYALDILLREHLVVVSSMGNLSFIHDKVHEASRTLLPFELKKNLCTVLAQFLEQVQGSHDDPFETAQYVMAAEEQCDPIFARKILHQAAERANKLFAYPQAKRYLENAVRTFPLSYEQLSERERSHWLVLHEALAQAQCVCEELEAGLALFDVVLIHITEPLARARIYAKKCKYYLGLFRYSDALEAGYQGLKDLNIRYLRYNGQALLALLVYFPVLIFILFRYLLLPSQKRTSKNEEETVALDLLVSIQVAAYYLRPLVACVNQFYVKVMRNQFFYQDSLARSMIVGYWGIVASSVGLASLARHFYRDALGYLQAFPNPEAEGFIWFCWGYVLDFHRGLEASAQEKCERSLQLLTSVGENFFRVNNFQCLVHVDHFCADSGRAAAASQELLDFWKRVPFIPSFLSVTARAPLLAGQIDEAQRRLQLACETLGQLKGWDAETIDYTYVLVANGEFHYYRDEFDEAIPPLRELCGVLLRRLHRIAYSNWGLVLLTRCYALSHRPFAALGPLILSWLNVLLGITVFIPQTLCATAECAEALGFLRLSDAFFGASLRYAGRKGWQMVLAECRYAFARSIWSRRPEYAAGLCGLAQEYFHARGQQLLVQACVRLQHRIRGVLDARCKRLNASKIQYVPSLIRSEIEKDTLLEVFLKLGATRDREALCSLVVEALSDLSGADQVLLWRVHPDAPGGLKDEAHRWPLDAPPVAEAAPRATMATSELLKDPQVLTGIRTLFTTLTQSPESQTTPSPLPETLPLKDVLQAHLASETPHVTGTALLFPVVARGVLWGVCFLGHRRFQDFFDPRSQSLSLTVLKQFGACAAALEDVERALSQARVDAELDAARAMQEALLPVPTPIPTVDIVTFYQSASVTGGDWFTYHYDASSQRVFFCIADVTGHGFSSALITAVVCGAIQSGEHISSQEDHDSLKQSPQEIAAMQLKKIAQAANVAVLKASHRSRKLATLCLLSLDVRTGLLSYLSAGHTPPLWVQQAKQTTKQLVNPGTRLGFAAALKVDVHHVQLLPQDALFLYTDGLIENTGPDGNFLSLKRTRQLLCKAQSVAQKQEEILHEARQMWGNLPADDDVTFVLAQWNPDPSVSPDPGSQTLSSLPPRLALSPL